MCLFAELNLHEDWEQGTMHKILPPFHWSVEAVEVLRQLSSVLRDNNKWCLIELVPVQQPHPLQKPALCFSSSEINYSSKLARQRKLIIFRAVKWMAK